MLWEEMQLWLELPMDQTRAQTPVLVLVSMTMAWPQLIPALAPVLVLLQEQRGWPELLALLQPPSHAPTPFQHPHPQTTCPSPMAHPGVVWTQALAFWTSVPLRPSAASM